MPCRRPLPGPAKWKPCSEPDFRYSSLTAGAQMNTAYFLINTIFDIYLMVVLLRVWLQWARADFYNPMSQMVVKVTNPLVIPLRRVIPGFGGVDMASVLLATIVAFA